MMNVYPLWLLSGISWCTLLCFPQLFAKASDTDGSSVRINEVMASNGITIADEDGDYEDWIELYNAGDASVNLGGWGLSDNYTNPFKWTFPENTILEKGDFLLVWASGKNRTSVDPAIDGDGATGSGEFHTNFAIAASGEEVLLTNPEGVRVDELGPREIPRNMSVGRVPDGTGEWFYFNESTPASPNDSTAYTEVLKAPGLSHTAGFYHEAVSLEATHERTDVALRYTLDGSEPTADSPEFPPQLVLASGEGDPNVFSAIKTTAGSDFWREPEFPVFKGNVVRVRAFRNGAMPSRTVSGTYFIGDSVSARYSLPVISVVTDGDNFFGDAKGIYVAGDGYDGDWQNSNYSQRGREWERPVHLEIFEKDGALALAQDAGARIHGGWSRRWAFKSLRFYARSDYGENTFDYQLFPDQPDDSYKRFIIRNSGNDHEFTLFRDAFMQRFVGHMNFDTQAYRPSIIFINGEYWGIKNMRERYDRFYLERTHGVDPNNIDLMTDIRTVKEGDASHYDALLEAIETHGVS
ncbi:MAG: lamin tail domain-containing protein, partial [Opitutales bacterium]